MLDRSRCNKVLAKFSGGSSGGSPKVLQITFAETLENFRRTSGDFLFLSILKTFGEPPENSPKTPGEPSEKTFCID